MFSEAGTQGLGDIYTTRSRGHNPISPIVQQQQGEQEDSREQEDDGLEEDLVDMEVGDGAQEVDRVVGKVRKDPGQPTREEVARHCATHLPYRSWCKHCVNRRGTAPPYYSAS